jgi:hypothetical protein
MASLLVGALLACAPASANDEPYDPEDSLEALEEPARQAEGLRHSHAVSAELQQEISQVLWGCYVVGADLVGAGDVQGAKHVLAKCYSDDMVFEAIMPPAYQNLNFTATGGAEGFVNAANQVYRGLNVTRTQHILSNIVIEKTGPSTAVVRSSGLAVHVYPDEHTFNATIKFVDDFARIKGVWKMTHRIMTVTSATEPPAWTP